MVGGGGAPAAAVVAALDDQGGLGRRGVAEPVEHAAGGSDRELGEPVPVQVGGGRRAGVWELAPTVPAVERSVDDGGLWAAPGEVGAVLEESRNETILATV